MYTTYVQSPVYQFATLRRTDLAAKRGTSWVIFWGMVRVEDGGDDALGKFLGAIARLVFQRAVLADPALGKRRQKGVRKL